MLVIDIAHLAFYYSLPQTHEGSDVVAIRLEELAYGVLLPVSTELTLDRDVLEFFDRGGRAILFGEYADEFRSGRMRPDRIAEETAERWRKTTADLRSRAGELVIACDGDMSAVDRLHAIAPGLPTLEQAEGMSTEQLETAVSHYARLVASLGVTMLLSPTADLIGGENEWLNGRTLGDNAASVDRLVAAYVRGAERGGIQTALKHFPGHHALMGNPATEVAIVRGSLETVLRHAGGFRAGIAAGASGVVMGSAVFEAVMPPASASLSQELIALLRQEFGFTGLVITLDLDHRSAQGDNTIEHTCINALAAGADLLLLSPSSVSNIPAITQAIAVAIDTGTLPLARLESAFASVSAAAR